MVAPAAPRERHSWKPEKMKAGRGMRPAFLSQSAWDAIEALAVWEGASTNGLGTVGGQYGCTVNNIYDVLRNVQ